MKNCMVKGLFLTGIIASLFVMNHTIAQDLQVYKHPRLNIRFEAPANWKENPYHKDKLIYEIFEPDTDMHVMLWYTTTEQSGPRYLEKMADMKGLVLEGKPVAIQIKGRDAWLYNVPGFINEKPIRTLLAVIPDGKSKTYPRENALYIIQVWCPEENYEQHMRIMENILRSVEITD
ncbi:MAG: hypothetical protein JSV96_03340 [Candidatus Aminicenantes bacterium]|nr:MAG: hypothetical protein JSV96_03340 [Candidatus Aminicenantes bacterium]